MQRSRMGDVPVDSNALAAERLSTMLKLSKGWLWEVDENHRFTWIDGLDEGQTKRLMASSFESLIERVEPIGFTWDEYKATFAARKEFQSLIMSHHESDFVSYVNFSGVPMFDEGRFVGYRGVTRDITWTYAERLQLREERERVQYLATHDSLTGLPNRAQFTAIVADAAGQYAHSQMTVAVITIGLDRFKAINDALGAPAGDALLLEAAQRLQRIQCADIKIARVGGDEFSVLVRSYGSDSDLACFANKILADFAEPFMIAERCCHVTASIGVSRLGVDATDHPSLIKNAGVAMVDAKAQGKNNVQLYRRRAETYSLERLALEASLREAVERCEFVLYYQPKICLRTRRITGVEALVRWEHPSLGVVSPASFIPLAEETGLIIPLGRWVLQEACRQNMEWRKAGLPAVNMAVNVSARQFKDPSLIRDVRSALHKAAMPAGSLEIELTETMVIENQSKALTVMRTLKAAGVKIAMDDFGVGYSSLAQLKHLPIDTLKIDRSFVDDLPGKQEDRAIAEAIIGLGRTLGLKLLAEGVENHAQEEFLRTHGCDETQGFYFSRPLEAEALAALLKRHDGEISGHAALQNAAVRQSAG